MGNKNGELYEKKRLFKNPAFFAGVDGCADGNAAFAFVDGSEYQR